MDELGKADEGEESEEYLENKGSEGQTEVSALRGSFHPLAERKHRIHIHRHI
jgi:hypothetical protein